jgi:hypothetical protein
MRIGTKSVLIGAHCFFLHPFFVAWGWTLLYGFPVDFRLWVAFFIHDIGYLGKPNMDGEEGEQHVNLGADIMYALFGERWRDECLYHSRYYSKKMGRKTSRLCAADKMAIALTPWWLYLPMVRFTGEIAEYKSIAKHVEENGDWEESSWKSDRRWFKSLQERMAAWAYANK